MTHNHLFLLPLVFVLVASACNLPASRPPLNDGQPVPPLAGQQGGPPTSLPTPLPTRPVYKPGELIDYVAQSGDSLPALAARFNTTIQEIQAANPIIPNDATTMPPGFPMKIPVYYRALWASPYKILPDSHFVNGPAVIGFNTAAIVTASNGWLKYYVAYAGGENRTGAAIVDYVAQNFSLSPRLLLAILEYKGGALSQPAPPVNKYLLGYKELYYESPYLQLVWAANVLNNGYYGWRGGLFTEFDEPDGTLVRPDPWQNAASVGIQYLFSRVSSGAEYEAAVGPDGLARTYQSLFGDPWTANVDLMPGSLRQPDMLLPFPRGQVWSYTGGPHTGWGTLEPYAAIDFAPPSEHSGCFKADEQDYAAAMADGLVVRSNVDGVVEDLDGDGDERTGWTIFYLHLSSVDRAPAGAQLHAGDKIGYPSCEGGRVTGTHVHIARKYNGEWILADGPLAFNLEGWIAHNGKVAYKGTLTRNGFSVTACDCSDVNSSIRSNLP